MISILFMVGAGSTATFASEAPQPAALQDILAESACATPATEQTGLWQTLQDFYRQRDYRPLWDQQATRDALRSQLNALADDGLDPEAYALPDEMAGPCDELQATRSYLLALQHLAHGYLAQDQVEPIWRTEQYAISGPNAAPSIAQAADTDILAAFEQARPDLPLYTRLRDAYRLWRGNQSDEWIRIPEGKLLRPQARDPRTPLLARRLQQAGLLTADFEPTDHYEAVLVKALKAFQARHSLQTDGVLGPNTLHALNVSPQSREQQIRINLERLRWINRDMEPELLLVDIDGGRVMLFRDRKLDWSTRVQVGQASRETPMLKSTVNRLTLNPTWTVPPTILKEDKLPKIRRDLGYLRRQHMRVLNYQGQELNPNQVDWSRTPPVMLRMDAGPHNPLGRVVLRFANPFAVYLHDTPSQQLFQRATRTFSSGCVRVEKALDLAGHLLSDSEQARVQSLLDSGKTLQYRLQQPMPILMAYWTADTDAEGHIQFRPDVYGKDPALIRALEGKRPL